VQCAKNDKMLYIQVNRRTLGRVSKPAVQLEEEELEKQLTMTTMRTWFSEDTV
jgi:hypothetical protein